MNEISPSESTSFRLDRGAGRIVLASTLCLLIIVGVRSPLTGSLWLDETVTAWVASGDWAESWRRAVTYQAQSPFYFMLFKAWPWRETSEFWGRFPSLIMGLGAAYALCILAAELFGREVLGIALLSVLTSGELVKAAIQARPYAMGMLGISWSVLALFRWIRTERLRHLVLHFAMALVAFYSHYLFSLVGVVYLGMIMLWGGRQLWGRYALGGLVSFFVALPGLYHLHWWSQKSGGALFTPLPSIKTFLQTLVPLQVVVYVVSASFVGFLFSQERPRLPEKRILLLVLIWIVGGSAVLFCLSHLSGAPVFMRRYLSWRAGGVVIGSVLVATLFREKGAQRAFCATYCLLALHMEASREWIIEDWTTAAFEVQKNSTAPIVLYSGLRESEGLSLEASEDFKTYLAAPLLVYGISPERVLVIPGDPAAPGVGSYMASIMNSLRASGGKFFTVINDQGLYVQGKGIIEPGALINDFVRTATKTCQSVYPADDERMRSQLIRTEWCELS